jgi:hypothetical protein
MFTALTFLFLGWVCIKVVRNFRSISKEDQINRVWYRKSEERNSRIQFRSYLRGTKFGEGCLDGDHTPVLLLDAHQKALVIEVVCSTCSDRLPMPELEDLPNYRSIRVGPLYQAPKGSK